MKYRFIYLPVFILVLVGSSSLTACGPNPSDEVVQAYAQVETLRAENESLSTQVAGLQATQADMAPRMQEMGDAISYFATQIAQPAAITQTAIDPTPVSEVSGMVVLNGGSCCAGSIAGNTITINAAFTASSSQGDVVEMKIVSGRSQVDMEEMAQAPWEPYVQEKSFPVQTASGWIGFWVHVQFRDSEGNVSPIYADDISVEGMPPIFTPTP